MGFDVILAIILLTNCALSSSEGDFVIPLALPMPKKRKDVNIVLDVNLGLGGPCTDTEILLGNCTAIPGGVGTFPPFPTPPTIKRKFEKYGEYIKVERCSYEFDDGKQCQEYCALLNYTQSACADLELCHCFEKANDPIPQGMRALRGLEGMVEGLVQEVDGGTAAPETTAESTFSSKPVPVSMMKSDIRRKRHVRMFDQVTDEVNDAEGTSTSDILLTSKTSTLKKVLLNSKLDQPVYDDFRRVHTSKTNFWSLIRKIIHNIPPSKSSST